MKLSYLKTLGRAWDRYALPGEGNGAPEVPPARAFATEDEKVGHLTDFMSTHKLHGTTAKQYTDAAGLHPSNLVTYTKWLVTGRLNVEPGELLDFYVARYAGDKTSTKETAHESQ